ncbi:glycerophosphodiester phosphodiesterase [Yaniella flava]
MTDRNLPPYFADSLPGRAGWPIGLAHRGADVQRENTMGAVREAVEQGFGYIEIDVRTSADGKVVVFHDEQLDRITTGTGRLSHYTWDELSTETVLGPQPRHEQVSEPLVLFEHLLETFPNTRFNVDLKDRASAAPMAEILRRHRAWDRVLIAAFRDSHRRLFFDHIQAEDHTVASSAGSESVAQLLLAHRLGRFTQTVRRLRQRLPLHALQVPVRQGWIRVVTKRFVDACHRAGIAVHVWVVNEQEEMERLLAMGVDGLVTDNGADIAEVLAARGQWPQRL